MGTVTDLSTRLGPRTFSVLSFPLEGMSLIEANAGTGKTFAITKLYLRLLLEREASVEQICVATFTEAAAAELTQRIRATINQALKMAQNSSFEQTEEDAETGLIRSILERVGNAKNNDGKANGTNAGDRITTLLRRAIIEFDRASIGTIHGLCARWRSEFAYSAGLDFEPGSVETGNELLAEVQANHWQRVLEGEPDVAALVLAVCRDLQQFRKHTQPQRVASQVVGKLARPVSAFDHERTRLQSMLEGFEQHHAANFVERNGAFDGWNRTRLPGKLIAADAAKLVAELYELAQQAMRLAFVRPKSWFPKTTDAAVADWVKKSAGPIPDPESIAAFRNLVGAIDSTFATGRAAALAVLDDLRASIKSAFDALKRDRQITTFDDLIDHLHAALALRPGLAAAITERYPYAMIDEFQDTSAVESEIFTTLFDGRGMLAMVGDPKQAIYGFKGGDVHAFLNVAARSDIARYRLTTNFRSTADCVDAVNQLFRNERRPFIDERLNYRDVTAGRADLGAGVGLRLIPVEHDGNSVAPFGLHELMVDATVQTVASILADESVHPREVAILVRSNRDVETIRKALTARGIAAASTGQTSVFSTREAQDLMRLVLALDDPSNEGLMRAALTGPLFGYTLKQLQAANADPEGWQILLNEFAGLRQFRDIGGLVNAAYRPLTRAAPRLLSEIGGKRALTNYLHLLELAQIAEQDQLGTSGLAIWLRESIDDPDASDPAQQIRIESDDRAVKVMTSHASKGLEFGFVVAPNLWSFFDRQDEAGLVRTATPIDWHEGDQRLRDLGSDRRAQAARGYLREEMAEDIRLIYVALTRARLGAYVLCQPMWTKCWLSGASWLFASESMRREPPDPGPQLKPEHVDEWFTELAGLSDSITLDSLDDSPAVAPSHLELCANLNSRIAPRPVPDDWQITSFTKLRQDHDVFELARETLVDASEADSDQADAPARLSALPTGAAFGNAFHDIMEHLDFSRPAGESGQAIRRGLGRAGLAVTDAVVDDVAALADRTIQADLDGAGLHLADIPTHARVVEMEFYFSLDRADPKALDRLIKGHPWSAHHCPDAFELAQNGDLTGLANGMIDLTFVSDERYYILDYKTNYLGPREADYSQQRMARAMSDANYALQYLIYSLALRRHVEQHRPGTFDAAYGGVYYLFVRGLGGPPGHGIYHATPPAELLGALDRLLAGEQS